MECAGKALAASPTADSRRPLWRRLSDRRSGTCQIHSTASAGAALFMVTAFVLPPAIMITACLCCLAVATCLRMAALSEFGFARRLALLGVSCSLVWPPGCCCCCCYMMRRSALLLPARSVTHPHPPNLAPPLAASSQQVQAETADAAGEEEDVEGEAGGVGGSTARRRLRRATLMAGRPLNLLNLRLSLMDRDFSDRDFQLLLRLDEVEAGGAPSQPASPVGEEQLQKLPVHLHRSPLKKGGGGGGGSDSGNGGGRALWKAAGPLRPLQLGAQRAPPQVKQVPVLVEKHPAQVPGAGSCCGGDLRACCTSAHSIAPGTCDGVARSQQQDAQAAAGVDDEEEDDDSPVCSVCLDAFVDGAEVGGWEVGSVMGTPPLTLAGVGALCCMHAASPSSEQSAPPRPPAQILSLPQCSHQYHADCVTQWLRLKGLDATCPNCKSLVFATPPHKQQRTEAPLAIAGVRS